MVQKWCSEVAVIIPRETASGNMHYRVQVRVSGFPAASATFPRIKDAKAFAAQTEADMRAGRYVSDEAARAHTAGDMIERYLKYVLPAKSTKPRYVYGQRAQLLWWLKKLRHYQLIKVNAYLLSELRDELLEGGRSHATVNRYMAALNHVFNTATKEWGLLQSNPMQRVRKLKESRGRTRFLSAKELERLLRLASKEQRKPLYDIILLALSTGARKGELLQIKLADVDISRACITIHDTKNHESRRLSLSSNALQMVQQRIAEAKSKQVFLFENIHTRQPYQIEREWQLLKTRAGLDDFVFHDLRHTFASYMAMSGASLAEIAEALGHKTLNMVKRYAHLCESHTAKVVSGMCDQYLTPAQKPDENAKSTAQEAPALPPSHKTKE